MSLIFCDSFDHYDIQTDKWDVAGTDCSIRLNTGQSRTGIGCLQVNSSAFGPSKSFAQTVDVLCGVAWKSDVAGSVMQFLDRSSGFGAILVRLLVNANGSLSVGNGFNQTYATSAPLLYKFNVYNSIAMRCFFSKTVGTIKVWINGVQVISTAPFDNTNGHNAFADTLQLMGPGLTPNTFIDDVYILDCGSAPNNNFLGNVRIFASVPFANGAPIQWTPSAGSNFAAVAEIPPDGNASGVSSFTVGQIDQYQYLATGVPPLAQIPAVQHVMDMQIATGARSVASVVNGIVNATAHPLASGYVMFEDPYDVNPSTALPWTLADFPAQFGPKVIT